MNVIKLSCNIIKYNTIFSHHYSFYHAIVSFFDLYYFGSLLLWYIKNRFLVINSSHSIFRWTDKQTEERQGQTCINRLQRCLPILPDHNNFSHPYSPST